MGFPIYFLRPSVFHVLTYTYKLEIKISPLARLLDTFKSNYLSIKFGNLLIDEWVFYLFIIGLSHFDGLGIFVLLFH